MKGQPTRLLIVDDEQDICDNLADIFGDLGYEVRVAFDGYSALELAKHETFDIALLDLRMPGMDGLELFRQMKTVSQGTAAIIITAYASGDTAQAAVEAGAWGVMSKPVDLQSLFKTIEDALGQPVVLVVDDDFELCDSLRDVLLQRQYRVCVAHDIPDAKEQLRLQDFQIVLLDVKLPAGSGTDLLQLIHAESPGARTILITGDRTEAEHNVSEAIDGGADA
ncbi:MAG: response regulator, partial [Planctomycetaceae bacterium]